MTTLALADLGDLDQLYGGGIAYLAINGGARDTTETIERYLPRGLLAPIYEGEAAWVAVVPEDWAQWAIDRLASGLIVASREEGLEKAQEVAAERMWSIRERRGHER